MKRPADPAFTLVELLVVITIIIVLLALLVPAMSKATYQATLAACAANLRGTATAVTVYAQDARRFYPDRGLRLQKPEETAKFISAMALTHPQHQYDMRPPLRGILSVTRSLQCPFCEVGLDLDNTPEDVTVSASYAMFWAWGYKGPNVASSQAWMTKLGETFTWGGKSYGVLVSDIDLRYPDGAQSSHPDYAPKKMTMVEAHDDVLFGSRTRLARWRWGPSLTDAVNRAIQQDGWPQDNGYRDLNYAYVDNSVMRLERVKNFWGADERTDYIPLQFDAKRPTTDLLQIPNVETR